MATNPSCRLNLMRQLDRGKTPTHQLRIAADRGILTRLLPYRSEQQ